MNLQEPKVEFVPIDQNVFTEASSACNGWDESGGGQRCFASQPEAKDCEDWDSQVPFSGQSDN